MKIALAADHAGFEYKNYIFKYLSEKGHQIHDFGTYSSESCDYPDYIHPLSIAVENKEFDFGIIFCGSGEGVSITANKHAGIRCALCWQTDIARLTRQHNNSNIVAIPARFIAKELAQEIIDTFLSTEFDGGRHQTRINKIAKW
ncbi:ribose 5-phosphate isomerase B [Apibacter adventoris]|uniref:Ribose 5-phosphate isomerase B n=1 Tax=Apibacter adventoris TaxID=1679466 RepID=A0A2S8A7E9_9FLAO|nr:ribose 5-phosphate isomerase B [Apibacter adventoris]PQL90495.1 ribose 5-phosphate isomerase B [Apibacter adventoris]